MLPEPDINVHRESMNKGHKAQQVFLVHGIDELLEEGNVLIIFRLIVCIFCVTNVVNLWHMSIYDQDRGREDEASMVE